LLWTATTLTLERQTDSGVAKALIQPVAKLTLERSISHNPPIGLAKNRVNELSETLYTL